MKELICGAIAVACVAPAVAQDYSISGGFSIYDDSETQLDVINLRASAFFGPNLGIEGEYSFGPGKERLGDFPGVVTGLQVGVKSDYAGYVVGKLPINDRFELFARAGYGSTEIEAKGSFVGIPGVTTASEDASGFRYGVGMLLHFNEDYGIRADVGRIEIDDEDLGLEGSVDVYSLGLFLNF